MARKRAEPTLDTKRTKSGALRIRYHDGERTRYKSTKCVHEIDAQRELERFRLLNDSDASLRRMLDRFQKERIGEASSRQSVVRSQISNLLQHFSDTMLADVDQETVDQYVFKRREGRIGRPSVDGTLRGEVKLLLTAMRHAARMKRIPATEIPYIDLPPDSPARERWLSDVEIDALLDAAFEGSIERMTRVYRFTVIALYTAARKRAIETLRWSQVDFKLGLIRLRPENTLETSKRRPTIPISDDLLPILQRAKDESINRFVLDNDNPISDAFARAVQRAGIAYCTPHTLRHTWATRAAMGGVALTDIADMLGDTVATVEKVYRHYCPEHLRSAANFWSAGNSENGQPTA